MRPIRNYFDVPPPPWHLQSSEELIFRVRPVIVFRSDDNYGLRLRHILAPTLSDFSNCRTRGQARPLQTNQTASASTIVWLSQLAEMPLKFSQWPVMLAIIPEILID